MAQAFLDEGQNTTPNAGQNDNVEVDAATSNWLKKNRLNHLTTVFAEESLTIDELMDMDEETLNTFLDDLVKDNTITRFKKRDKLRIMSKLKSKNNKPEPKQQFKRQPIITEAEISALDSLDNKYKELSLQTKSIEKRLNEFENEYIKQQKILNTSFNQILSNVETRRNVLLNQMKQKRDKYKQKLGTRMKSVANQRSLLDQIKSKCENDINNSDAVSLKDAKKRANKTVQLIDETLLSVEQHFDDSKINNNIYVKFDISQRINDDIKQCGNVKIIGDKPPVPIINFVQISTNQITIEMLCDQNYTSVISKYEYQRLPSSRIQDHSRENDVDMWSHYKSKSKPPTKDVDMFSRYKSKSKNQASKKQTKSKKQTSQFNDVKKDEVRDGDIISVINENNRNVVFTNLTGLQSGTTYKIRVRAVVNDNVTSNWSQWFSTNTKHPQSRSKKKSRQKLVFPLQKKSVNLDEWYQLCKANDASLSLYQSQRVFDYVLFQFNFGRKRQNADTVSVNRFNRFIWEELHCAEWKQFQQHLWKIYNNNNNNNNDDLW